jgi:hypothetical protein
LITAGFAALLDHQKRGKSGVDQCVQTEYDGTAGRGRLPRALPVI